MLTTVPVTFAASDQNGNPLAGARIMARLDKTEISGELVAPEEVTATTDASGVAVLNLWPNALGVAGSLYRVRAWNPDTGKRFLDTTISVPNSACNLHDIIVAEPYPEVDASALAVITAQAAAATATTQAGLATTNGAAQVTLAAAQVTLAETQAGIATTQAGTAATQASNASTSATAAAGSATAAAGSATAAAASATTASSQAATASNRASAAADSATAAAASATATAGAIVAERTATATLTNKTIASPALTGNVTVATNSTSPALLITQDGTGNALEVRDVTGDATPFVVDANGRVAIASATGMTGAALTIGGDSATGLLDAFRSSADNSGFVSRYFKNRNTNTYANTIVQNNDVLGGLVFAGADGTNYIQGAFIRAEVDGTPGTNDMPGRLVFSTTADGASSPTERMRITSNGSVGIGCTPTAELEVGDGTGSRQISINGASSGTGEGAALLIKNGNTTYGGFGNPSALSGVAAYSNMLDLTSYYGLTFSTLSTERMRIDSSGAVGIGTTSLGARTLDIGKAITGGTSAYGVVNNGVVQSDVTSSVEYYRTTANTAAASFTLSEIKHYAAYSSAPGAGSAVTTQYGFLADASLANSTNSYGFYSNISSGTGRWNFYAAGTAANYFGGNVTVGGGGTLGYGTGSGGTVTQATSKSTAVTLNKPSGQITMHNAALAAGASVTFKVDNNTIVGSDTVIVTPVFGAFDGRNYTAEAAVSGTGIWVTVKNTTAGSLSEALALNFTVIKGSLS